MQMVVYVCVCECVLVFEPELHEARKEGKKNKKEGRKLGRREMPICSFLSVLETVFLMGRPTDCLLITHRPVVLHFKGY